jgi:single-stranded DNA-binding protein
VTSSDASFWDLAQLVFRVLSVRVKSDRGAHILVEGELVSSTYERPNGKGKKSATTKNTSWSIRADVVRKLDRGEPQPEAAASATAG